MRIISKYLLKEHVGPFTFALTALTSLMLLQYIARRFGDLVGKGLPWQVILEFFLLSVPFTVAMTLPMAVLLAVLYAFSRLASENEVTAMKAGGISMRRLTLPVLAGAFFLAASMIAFNDQLLPRANHRLAVLQLDIFRTKPTFALKEQVINTVKEGQFYLRAGRLDEGSAKMRDVVIYDLADPVRRRTIYADSGTIALAPNLRDLDMVLYHGMMQTVPTDKPGELTRLYYQRDRLRVVNVAGQFQQTSDADTVSKGDREMSICEMQGALVKSDTMLQRKSREMQIADWEDKSAKGKAVGPKPVMTPVQRPLGIGGLYCLGLAGVGKIVGLRNDVKPKAPKAPAPSSGLAANQQPGNIASTTLPPSAGGGFTPDQRLTIAKLDAEEAHRLRNRYDVEIQKKFSLAAACFIFVLVGAPIALRFPRGGVGLVMGVSFFIFALYYVGLIGGESLADKGLLSPFWAMWSTNVIMTVIGLLLISRMGKESNSGRGGGLGELLAMLRSRIARVARRVGIPMERRVA